MLTVQNISPATERANARLLYFELAWMAIPFAMEWYYLQVYAIRLNATPLHLGLLISGRAFFLVVGNSLAHQWQRRYPNAIRALSSPVLVSRFLLYMAIALTPFLPGLQVETLAALVVLSAVPQGISQGIFLGMLPIAVGKDALARVVAQRSALMNLTVLPAVFVAGQTLQWVASPLNYQIGFALAFAASFMSWWNIRHITIPNQIKVEVQHSAPQPIRVWSYMPFRRLALVAAAVNISVFMAGPLIPLHLVRGLSATDGWISLFAVFEMGAGALLTLFMARLIRRFSMRRLIIATILTMAVQPFILALTPTLPPHIVGSIAFGAGWFAINVLLYNRMVEIVPSDHLPPFAAAYQAVINFSLFLGPLIGTFLIENIMTIPAALLVVASLRFGAGILAWAVRTEPALEAAPLPTAETVQSPL